MTQHPGGPPAQPRPADPSPAGPLANVEPSGQEPARAWDYPAVAGHVPGEPAAAGREPAGAWDYPAAAGQEPAGPVDYPAVAGHVPGEPAADLEPAEPVPSGHPAPRDQASPEGPAGAPARPWPPRGRHPGYTPRTPAGLAAYERALVRAGLAPVAGIDEAGRGACAGPLVVAAVMLARDGRAAVPGLADSKELLPAAREEVYRHLVRTALSWHVVVIPPGEIDRFGLHVCNVTGMRRALAGLRCRPGYVLTDGFPVRGLDVPSLAMWKGDQVAACVAAASILAKVTRDRIMTDLDQRHPLYGFARHKGYCTPDHKEALMDHGPCSSHRFSYVNVIEAARARGIARAMPVPAATAGGEPSWPRVRSA